jgi:hypothetical protein
MRSFESCGMTRPSKPPMRVFGIVAAPKAITQADETSSHRVQTHTSHLAGSPARLGTIR